MTSPVGRPSRLRRSGWASSWCDGRRGGWNVADADREAELAYLRSEIYGGEVHLAPLRITAFERFSERA